MTMGIIDQTIEKVVQVQNKVYVFGENFTTQSKVHINGEFYSTGFVNENLVRVNDLILEDGDEVSIKQLAPNKLLLSEEMAVTYKIPEKKPPKNPPQETNENTENESQKINNDL